jgi:SAM-dependent methyltransferase
MAVLDDIQQFWDDDAATYDNAPGHRPRTAAERAAWTAALAGLLPPPPARVLDCGAGTGFLSLIAARLGHRVTAIDLSRQMLDRLAAAAAALGVAIETVQAPANQPPAGPFDAVMERHLVWTLPDPTASLEAWRAVAPNGRLVLVESLWGGADPVESIRGQGREVLDRLRRRPPITASIRPRCVLPCPSARARTHPGWSRWWRRPVGRRLSCIGCGTWSGPPS